MKNKILLFAYKTNGDFFAERIIDDLDSALSRLEYGDVLEGEYQIWEYPSGKLFNITPDKEVEEKDYYSTPNTNTGVKWLPKLMISSTDKNKVAEAYKRLSSTN